LENLRNKLTEISKFLRTNNKFEEKVNENYLREEFYMKKKVSYVDLLKEAISEYDVKTFDYKGPMTEPIIGYTGDGEMETHKDAASILERYYFNEKSDSGVNVLEQTAEEPDPEEKNEIVTGDTPDDVDETMDDFEDEILDDETSVEEALELSEDVDILENADLLGEEDLGDSDEIEEGVAGAVLDGSLGLPLGVAGVTGGAAAGHMAQKKFIDNESEELSMESAILEKLIEEMENEEDEKEGEKADQAGVSDGEQGDVDAAKEEPLDVDKKVATKESFPIGPLSKASGKSDRTAKEEIEEAFKIFKEEIMMEEDDGETPAGNEEAGAAGKEKALGDELDDEDLGLQKEDFSLEEDLDFLGEDFLSEEDEEEEKEEEGEEEEEEGEEEKEKVKGEEIKS